MPIIKSAEKKVRKDKKRSKKNIKYIAAYKKTLKEIKKDGKQKKELLNKFYALVDKAAKAKVINKNKAARLKSRIAKLISKK